MLAPLTASVIEVPCFVSPLKFPRPLTGLLQSAGSRLFVLWRRGAVAKLPATFTSLSKMRSRPVYGPIWPSAGASMQRMIDNFRIGPYAMRYSAFVPRLYNLCRSLGFERHHMLPSRAFCSDESQGYPIILIAQHFGTFPFDHGRVGGKVSVNRHGPYAAHGEDLVIIQATHVGYDADSGRFGVYRRERTDGCGFGSNCGKLAGVLHWYHEEYQSARELIRFGKLDGEPVVYLDNQFLDDKRTE